MSGPHDCSKPPKLNQIWFLIHNPFICIVSIDVDSCVNMFWHFECDVSNFHSWTNPRIYYIMSIFMHIHYIKIRLGVSVSNEVMELWGWSSHKLSFPVIILIESSLSWSAPQASCKHCTTNLSVISGFACHIWVTTKLVRLCRAFARLFKLKTRNLMSQLAYLIISLSWVTIIQFIIFPSAHPMTVSLCSLIYTV